MTLIEQKVRIIAIQGAAPGQKESTGQVRIQEWTSRERTLRAAKWWGICWVVGLFCVLLPLIHFVLVPALLIAGPVGAYVLFYQESVVMGGEGVCPECQAALPIVRARNQFPMPELCSGCQSRLSIERQI